MYSEDREILEKLSFLMSVDTGMLNTDQMKSLAKNQIYSHRMKEAKLRFLSQKAIFADKEVEKYKKEQDIEQEKDFSRPFQYKVISSAKTPISKAYTKMQKGNLTTEDIKSLINQLQALAKN